MSNYGYYDDESYSIGGGDPYGSWPSPPPGGSTYSSLYGYWEELEKKDEEQEQNNTE